MRLELINYLECLMQNYLKVSVYENRDLYSLCNVLYEKMFDQEKLQRLNNNHIM